MGKLGKFLACVGGAAVAVVAAPAVLSAAAGTVVGSVVIGAGTAVAGAASAAVGAAGATAVGSAVVGAGTAVAGAASAAVGAAGATAVGSAVVGAGTAAAGAAGTAIVAGASAVGVTTTVAAGMAAATVGAGITYSGLTSLEGFSNSIEADEKISKAKLIYKRINSKLEKSQQATINKMESLNQTKVDIYTNEINESIKIIEKIKNIKQSDTMMSELNFKFTPEEIVEMKRTSIEASKIAKNSLDGIGMSTAMSSMATGLVANFGVASTGTAISSLSGAAAQRATLAALGGGAIQAGGAGMVGGQIMLGGVSLVPTAVIMSHKYAQNSEKKLTEATKYYSQIRKEVGKIEETISWVENSVNPRINEIHMVLEGLRKVYSEELLWRLKDIEKYRSNNGKINMNECSSEEQRAIVNSFSFIKSIKEIIKAPILSENGIINEETKNILDMYGDTNKLYV
jgi:hypothetical protein